MILHLIINMITITMPITITKIITITIVIIINHLYILDYGPIRHSNGLCLNVKDGSHNDGTPLIWSRDCTSRNAFFLVPHDLPPYHVASGKCVLPKGYVSSFYILKNRTKNVLIVFYSQIVF